MVRRSAKTTAVMLSDVNRWFAAEWKRMRDARMTEARCTETLARRAAVRAARFANREFVRYMREASV